MRERIEYIPYNNSMHSKLNLALECCAKKPMVMCMIEIFMLVFWAAGPGRDGKSRAVQWTKQG
jgi:hypothetical protein